MVKEIQMHRTKRHEIQIKQMKIQNSRQRLKMPGWMLHMRVDGNSTE